MKWQLFVQGLLMLNVHDLERRWLRYKIKSYLPYFLSIIGLTALTIGTLFYFPNLKENNIEVQVMKEKKAVVENKSIPKQEIEETETKDEVQVSLYVPQNTREIPLQNSKSLVLEPSLHFMDNIEDGLTPYIGENKGVEVSSIAQYTDDEAVDEPRVKSREKIEEKPPVHEKKTMLTITKNKDESDIKDVIRRFKKNKNPALSLFIAKRYYELHKYQSSYNYALITNEIDKNIDQSWIIFSKSLVKLGQEELAALTLKSYLKTSKSTQAEILLRKIESGEFK